MEDVEMGTGVAPTWCGLWEWAPQWLWVQGMGHGHRALDRMWGQGMGIEHGDRMQGMVTGHED